MASLSKPTRRFFNARLVDLAKLAAAKADPELAEISTELFSVAAHAAFVATYLHDRELGRDHAAALRHANATRRIVRRRFGYHTTTDINV